MLARASQTSLKTTQNLQNHLAGAARPFCEPSSATFAPFYPHTAHSSAESNL